MEKKPLVSVIIPTHSGHENICRAVDSVLNQSYDNIEVLVVDDNGMGCEEQVLTSEKMDTYRDNPKVRYLIHEVNKNGSAARNTGIRAAQGDYITFLDDDDVYTPENIQKHLEVWGKLSEEYGITYCDMLQIRPGMKDSVMSSDKSGDLLFEYFMGKVFIGSCLIMVNRAAMNHVKEWDETFIRHQDWEFITRIMNKYKAAHVDNIGAVRYVTNRHNAKNPYDFMKNRLHFIEKMRGIIEEFESPQQQAIYDSHYRAIGLEFFKSRKIRECIAWTNKTTHPCKNYISYFVSGYRYLKKKTGNKCG